MAKHVKFIWKLICILHYAIDGWRLSLHIFIVVKYVRWKYVWSHCSWKSPTRMSISITMSKLVCSELYRLMVLLINSIMYNTMWWSFEHRVENVMCIKRIVIYWITKWAYNYMCSDKSLWYYHFKAMEINNILLYYTHQSSCMLK